MERLEPLRELVGQERSVRGVCQPLHLAVAGMDAPAVGAVHITCADESEHECVAAFQQGFAQYVLPSLKFGQVWPFRLANLGGRYEWGALPIAEEHYATEASTGAWKLVVVKVNAHVAVTTTPAGPRFGTLERYGRSSTCCGALQRVLEGGTEPFVRPLEDALHSEGRDRIAALRDEARVDPAHRALHAALASARLQARAAMLDAQDHTPASPTLYAVLACVTLNRPGPDGEILVGYYVADRRGERKHEFYYGLGDDPAAYVLTVQHDKVVVSDDHVGAARAARDHRQLALSHWQARAPRGHPPLEDDRLRRIHEDVEKAKHHEHPHGRLLLRALLVLLSEVAPVPAAVLLFAHGAADIHHAFRMHRLTQEVADSEHAQAILDEIHDRVDELEPQEVQAVLELLLEQHRAS